MRSLFVLSLPRSLSCEVHQLCCDALSLRAPSWTSAGEILNLDRFTLPDMQAARFPKYILPRHGHVFAAATRFLEQAFVPEGFCYKDVVQPFVAAAWLRGRPWHPVLKIRPNVAHAAFAMLQRNWLYPTMVGQQSGSLPVMMVEGLLAAAAALDDVPGETIDFDDLMLDPAPLARALEQLYPGTRVTLPSWGPEFERRRDDILRRRTFSLYRQLEDIADAAQQRFVPPPVAFQHVAAR